MSLLEVLCDVDDVVPLRSAVGSHSVESGQAARAGKPTLPKRKTRQWKTSWQFISRDARRKLGRLYSVKKAS